MWVLRKGMFKYIRINEKRASSPRSKLFLKKLGSSDCYYIAIIKMTKELIWFKLILWLRLKKTSKN